MFCLLSVGFIHGYCCWNSQNATMNWGSVSTQHSKKTKRKKSHIFLGEVVTVYPIHFKIEFFSWRVQKLHGRKKIIYTRFGINVESVLVKIECLSLRIHVDLNPLTWLTISSFVPLDNKSWFTVVKKLCCHFCKCYF